MGKVVKLSFIEENWENVRLLKKIISDIKQANNENIILNSKKKKELIMRVLDTVNLAYVDKKTTNNSIVMPKHSQNKFLKIIKPVINRKFAELDNLVKSELNNIQNLHLIEIDDYRLAILKNKTIELYDFKIHGIESNFIIELKNKFRYFDRESEYLYFTIIGMIKIIEAIKVEKLLCFDRIYETYFLQEKEIRYTQKIIMKLLSVSDLTYFNMIQKNEYGNTNYTNIPNSVRKLVSKFEFEFREFFTHLILKNRSSRSIESFFYQDFEMLKQKAISSMIETNEHVDEIENFRKTQQFSHIQIRKIVDELLFSAYMRLIKHNSDILGKIFDNFDYQRELKELKDLRNIDKHEKSQIYPNLSYLISLFYKYTNIFET